MKLTRGSAAPSRSRSARLVAADDPPCTSAWRTWHRAMSRRIGWSMFVALGALALTAPGALAATIGVTSTSDTNTNTSCSLRQAVKAANTDTAVGGCSAGSGADVITLHRGSTYSLGIAGRDEDSDATGDLDVSGPTTIKGSGATLDAAGIDRFLTVLAGGTLTLQNATVRGGAPPDSGDSAEGGALLNSGRLTLKSVTVTANHSAEFAGGAIVNDGVLTISGSVISGNHVDLFTYGPAAGGITNEADGTLTISGSKISGNDSTGLDNEGIATVVQTTISGHDQSGVFNAGQLHLTNSTVSGNTSTDAAGGVGNAAGGQLWITGSTISGNSVSFGQFGGAEFLGGGIYNRGALHLENTTISANRAALACDIDCGPDTGGGVQNDGSGTIDANAVTITANQAGTGGGGLANTGGAVRLTNTIIAGNTLEQAGATAPDCSGTLTAASYSVLGHAAGCAISSGTGNLLNVDPRLGSLAANGGATQTHTLLSGSPAIDTGSPSRKAGCLTRDQRGVARPQDGNGTGVARCDIGAVEVAAR